MALGIMKFLNTATHFAKSTFAFQQGSLSQAFGTTRYYSLFGQEGNQALETDVQQAIGEDITVLQVIINIPTGFNTLDGSTTIRLRDDVASVGSTITILAGVDGKIITTLAAPPTILANSLCDTEVVTAGTLGTLRIESIQWNYQRTII